MSQAPITMTVYVTDDHHQKVAINDKIFGQGSSWQEAFQQMINLPNFGGTITEAMVAHNSATSEKPDKPDKPKESHKHSKKDD